MITLRTALDASSVTPPFRQAVADFVRSGRPTEALRFSGNPPSVKIERTLTMLLTAFPQLPVEQVEIVWNSGCEFFRGEMVIRSIGEERRVAFDWDCKWKAKQLGWRDYFGFPDQIRAARELGHDCFRAWLSVEVKPISVGPPSG